MGAQFPYVRQRESQLDPVQKRQNEWVPRSPDVNGGGKQGMRLVGLVFGEEVLFDAANGTIADTAAHMSHGPTAVNPTGTNFDQVYAVYKTALVTSTLNQSVSLQPMWSRDGTTWYAFDTATSVTAYSGTGPAQSTTIFLSTPTLYLPYVALQATCATAPTSGELLAWLERLG